MVEKTNGKEMRKMEIRLNKQDLQDKILACWIGKNIGGTLGGAYEGVRK